MLIVDPPGGAVAAAHAGWRGTVAGVSRAAVRERSSPGLARPATSWRRSAPAIEPCCYEVGDELREAFGAGGRRVLPSGAARAPASRRARGQPRQLLDAGLRPQAIHHVADCTHCHPDRYHSYRRDGMGAGRMISFVGFRL